METYIYSLKFTLLDEKGTKKKKEEEGGEKRKEKMVFIQFNAGSIQGGGERERERERDGDPIL